ncbi:MAG: DegT/DnrJ/EryC1/StrS family aminotransferase [Blastocatellales bacterium]
MTRLAIFGGEPIRRKPFASWPQFDEREKAALIEVLESGVWGGYNPKVAELERAFADFHDAKFGVAAANGTVTLEAALIAAGVGVGDEVIVPPISFIATATAVLRLGAAPVFADIDESTYNLDPARISEAITERTRAIIPVHFAGQPVDMDAILEIAEESDLAVIEDCAHAHGAEWRGKKVGSLGTFGSFSFQASKNMTAGEGGALTTNDKTLAERARSVCNQGRRTGGAWYEHVRLGTNYRLTGWQAAVLLTQLERLPEQLATRTANAKYLTEQLSQFDIVTLPYVDERVTCHSYYLYPLRLNREPFPGLTKEQFVRALVAEGIPVAEGYPHPLYRNHVFEQHAHRRGECPAAERMCAETFWVSHEIMLAERDDLSDFVTALARVSEAARELTTSES